MVLVHSVEQEGIIIAHVYDLNMVAGSSFPTPEHFPLQFGVGSTPEGRVIPPHVHTSVERKLDATGEFIFMLEGAMNVVFLNRDGHRVAEHKIDRHMAFLQIVGGHRITFEAGAKYFEVKQGPYLGRDADKRDVTII
jgi:hypothetical protein